MTTPSFTLPPALRAKYLGQVATRCSQLSGFLAHCANREATDDEFQNAQACAHNLHGSGKTYGFPAITETARALEDALDANHDQNAIAPLVQAVINACTQAIHTQTVEQSAEPQAGAPPAAAPAVAGATRRPVILIAEDDAAIAEALQQLFSNDADLLLADNGRTALALIEERKPDLVILDDTMPEMTGAEVLERLSRGRRGAQTHIVMLTANNRVVDIVRGISAGAIDYVTKPFEPGSFAVHIRRLLKSIGTKVLLADDDPAVRGLLLYKFRKLGFHVLQAEDGAHAMRLIEEERPNIVILDRMMPGMDGLAVLRKIRGDAQLKAMPVILLTAKRHNRDVVEGFDVGATDYVVKPFMPDEVVARALRQLGIHEGDRP